MSRFFYHGIRNGYSTFDTVIDIFKTGGIKSKRLQKRSYRIGFNGPDFISICRKGNNEDYEAGKNNAFYNYIFNHFCFIIKEDIDAVKCKYTPEVQNWERFELARFMNMHPEIRISDMFDEWQVKNEIDFSYIIGIGIPLKWLESMQSDEPSDTTFLINQIIEMAHEQGLDIIDSSIPTFVEDYENSKLELKTLQLTLEKK